MGFTWGVKLLGGHCFLQNAMCCYVRVFSLLLGAQFWPCNPLLKATAAFSAGGRLHWLKQATRQYPTFIQPNKCCYQLITISEREWIWICNLNLVLWFQLIPSWDGKHPSCSIYFWRGWKIKRPGVLVGQPEAQLARACHIVSPHPPNEHNEFPRTWDPPSQATIPYIDNSAWLLLGKPCCSTPKACDNNKTRNWLVASSILTTFDVLCLPWCPRKLGLLCY